MRRITCDAHEFGDPNSEQFLSLAVASPDWHCPNLITFMTACDLPSTHDVPVPVNWSRWQQVAEHLKKFAGLELPPQSQVRESRLLNDEWVGVELLVAFESDFVWYHWCTTA